MIAQRLTKELQRFLATLAGLNHELRFGIVSGEAYSVRVILHSVSTAHSLLLNTAKSRPNSAVSGRVLGTDRASSLPFVLEHSMLPPSPWPNQHSKHLKGK